MTGIELITKEREEQLLKHKRTIQRDFHNNDEGQLLGAAVSLLNPRLIERVDLIPHKWERDAWEKMCMKDEKERLIISGALIAAEIDRSQYEQSN